MLTINGGEVLAIVKILSEKNVLDSLEDRSDRKIILALCRLVFASLDFNLLRTPIFDLVQSYKKCLIEAFSKGVSHNLPLTR